MPGPVLVAGIGNIFHRDDGFGPEVARRLDADRTDDVRVVDYGIRGMHLAYDLLDHEGPLVTVLAVGPEHPGAGEFDAHGMNPVAVLANLEVLGGTLPRTYVVGCVPADLSEGIGLTDVVTAALDEALATVRGLVADLQVGV